MRWSRFSLSWFEKNNCRKNSVNVKKYYFFNRDLKLMLCALGKKCMTAKEKKTTCTGILLFENKIKCRLY